MGSDASSAAATAMDALRAAVPLQSDADLVLTPGTVAGGRGQVGLVLIDVSNGGDASWFLKGGGRPATTVGLGRAGPGGCHGARERLATGAECVRNGERDGCGGRRAFQPESHDEVDEDGDKARERSGWTYVSWHFRFPPA
ncbi:hypothetical protein E2562_014917 [Oryza meyeriana var. granulata]|uniref:Uncharacterized protein n=1 Tax=Oryza meyeriana var. granulata TaxID=110450 RepID=A0A6G1EJG3_9ORYZ|nr:hypothetical protein E2562_014917 [Oryza meyeriana var. granulata]